MGPLIDIINHSMGTLLWGVLIGAGCLVLFFLLIKGWYKDAHFTIVTYVVGAVLGCLLMIQCVLICGSISILRLAHSYEPILTGIVEQIESIPDAYISGEDSNAIVEELVAQTPLLGHYIGNGEFIGYKVSELPAAMVDELESYMGWYIFRRVLWCLGFVSVGAFIVIKTMEVSRGKSHRLREATAAGGGSMVRADRHRPGRATRRIGRRR